MFKPLAMFGRKKRSKPFKDYYKEWISTLKKSFLPQLRQAMSSNAIISPTLLSIQVDAMHKHFQAYYEALDEAATDDIAQVLFPEWRNALEKPFLWLGDHHPYLFINLLRSFLDDEETQEDEEEDGHGSGKSSNELFEKVYEVVMAYRSPSKKLTTRVDQIECGLRLMVPALVARAREAQAAFVERVGAEWGRKEKAAVGAAVETEMEEMTGVFLDANRVRKSVLADVLSVTNVYQAAVFLEALARFLVGFRSHKLLKEFDKCLMPINL